MAKISNSWIAHCKEKYPREFATPNRMKLPITSNDHLISLSSAYSPGHNCFVSVYSFTEWIRIPESRHQLDYTKAVIDCVFIDLDWKINPEVALYEARLLEWACRHKDTIVRIYFSGMKGFAIYFDFKTLEIDPAFKKDTIRYFIEYVEKSLNLKTLDRQCTDSISRVSRLPDTKHQTSGLYCIPLSYNDLWHINGFGHIMKIAAHPSSKGTKVTESNYVRSKLQEFSEVVANKYLGDQQQTSVPVPSVSVPRVPGTPNTSTVSGTLCPGVTEIIAGVQEGRRDNCLCGLISGLNLQLGMSRDDIFVAISNWVKGCTPPLDYDDYILSSKVSDIVSLQYRPCTFLIRAGIRSCRGCI